MFRENEKIAYFMVENELLNNKYKILNMSDIRGTCIVL